MAAVLGSSVAAPCAQLYNCDAAVNQSYMHHSLVVGQFCLPAAYGTPNPAAASCAALLPVSNDADRGRKRPSKRRRMEAIDDKNPAIEDMHPSADGPAVEETQLSVLPVDRHAAILKLIAAAAGTVLAAIPCANCRSAGCAPLERTVEPDGAVADSAGSVPERCASHGNGSDAVHVAGQRTDWVQLASLKAVLRPKLRIMPQAFSNKSGSTSAVAPATNLFDVLVGNASDFEVEARAHEALVLLPARCRLMMSDISRLQPLLQGAPGSC